MSYEGVFFIVSIPVRQAAMKTCVKENRCWVVARGGGGRYIVESVTIVLFLCMYKKKKRPGPCTMWILLIGLRFSVLLIFFLVLRGPQVRENSGQKKNGVLLPQHEHIREEKIVVVGSDYQTRQTYYTCGHTRFPPLPRPRSRRTTP